MSGVGRGRGAVMPAWMKAKALDQNPAPGSAAPEEAASAVPQAEKTSVIGSKRAFDADDSNDAATAAAAAHGPALPPGWHESFDPQYQRNYYYNYSTGERTWTKPEWKPNAAPIPAAAAAAALPASARWEKAIDLRGKPYYYNHATKESSWTLPEGAALLEEAIAAAAPATAAPAKKQREEEPEEGEVAFTAAKDNGSSQATQIAEKSLETNAIAIKKDQGEEQQLPSGWAQAVDPGSGTTYYYNNILNITQWHHPSASTGAAGNTGGVTGGGGGGQGGGGVKRPQPATKRTNQPALDPMDPSSYSDTPRGGWGAGLGKETAM